MKLVWQTAAPPPPPGHRRPRRGRAVVLRVAALLALGGLLAAAFLAGALLHRDGTVTAWALATRSRLSLGYLLGFPFARNRLPLVRVDMKFADFEKVTARRNQALANRILKSSDADFVPARWQAGDQRLEVKMRLKGDWVDHLQGFKWSYRVQVRKDQTFLGMRRFSIQHPATRNFLLEWAYHEQLRSEGLLGLRYDFVNLDFNGRKLGIYAVEEHFAKELLESQQRQEGPIVKFDEDALWSQRIVNARRYGPYTDAFLADPDDALFDPDESTALVSAFGADHPADRPDAASGPQALRDTALGLLRGYAENRLAASDVFEPELLGRFLAVVELWSAGHQLDWHNLRFYYNPHTGRLEPIGFDAEPTPDPATHLLGLDFSLGVLDDPRVARAYVRELRRMSAPEYLDSLRTRLGPRYRDLARILSWEFGLLPEPWALLAERQRLLRLELEPVELLAAYLSWDPNGGAPDGRWWLELRSVARLPVELGPLTIDGQAGIDPASLLVPAADAAPARLVDGSIFLPPTRSTRQAAAAEYARFRLDTSAGPASGVEVRYRLAGDTAWRTTTARPYPQALSRRALPPAPTLAETLAAHPWLTSDPDRAALVVAPGEWPVRGNLRLPDGLALVAGPGTTLRFDPGAYLLATGPLLLTGSPEQPVVLGPRAGSWGGVAVVGSGRDSTWQRVDVLHTTGVNIQGMGFSSGVTFYQSSLQASDCRFLGSQAEDTLNVKRARLRLARVEFADTASDALDGDFVDARISDCSFHDVHGDALDVSGADAEIDGLVALRIGDKVVSVGEGSRARLRNLRADQVSIGIASKDGSTVVARDAAFHDVRTAVLAAYTKKSSYGPATIEIAGLAAPGIAHLSLVDLDSRVTIDGRQTDGQVKLDIDHLYAIGVFGN